MLFAGSVSQLCSLPTVSEMQLFTFLHKNQDKTPQTCSGVVISASWTFYRRRHQEHARPLRDHHLAVRRPDNHPVQLHCQPDLHPHRAAADVPDHGHRQPDRQRRAHRVPGRVLRGELPGARAGRLPVEAQGAGHPGRVQAGARPRPSQRRRRGRRRRASVRRALPSPARQGRDRGRRVHQERLGLRESLFTFNSCIRTAR